MVTMVHPNGCVHDVRDDLVEKFLASGWVVKAAQSVPPFSPAEEPKQRKPRKKKQ